MIESHFGLLAKMAKGPPKSCKNKMLWYENLPPRVLDQSDIALIREVLSKSVPTLKAVEHSGEVKQVAEVIHSFGPVSDELIPKADTKRIRTKKRATRDTKPANAV